MRGNPMLDKLDKQLIAKIKDWLEDELGTYSEYEDDVCVGRKECAEMLLEQINKWEKENESMENICW